MSDDEQDAVGPDDNDLIEPVTGGAGLLERLWTIVTFPGDFIPIIWRSAETETLGQKLWIAWFIVIMLPVSSFLGGPIYADLSRDKGYWLRKAEFHELLEDELSSEGEPMRYTDYIVALGTVAISIALWTVFVLNVRVVM